MGEDAGWEEVRATDRRRSEERRIKGGEMAPVPRPAQGGGVENSLGGHTNTSAMGAATAVQYVPVHPGVPGGLARPPGGPAGPPAKKKRPKRKHGEAATGVVRRRADWDDHCLIEMADGFEDVFCHRHRCQGKALPEQGQIVHFKLHLSSKSLCWQSGFVTWDEGERVPQLPPRHDLPGHGVGGGGGRDDQSAGSSNENRAPPPPNVWGAPRPRAFSNGDAASTAVHSAASSFTDTPGRVRRASDASEITASSTAPEGLGDDGQYHAPRAARARRSVPFLSFARRRGAAALPPRSCLRRRGAFAAAGGTWA